MSDVLLVLLSIETVVLIAAAAIALYRWRQRQQPPPAIPNEYIVATVRQVFAEVGLPAEQFSMTYNLKRTGKLMEILHHCGDRLGVDVELDTVGDVVKWLS